jgi:predicted SAM-dependent methyltransferase
MGAVDVIRERTKALESPALWKTLTTSSLRAATLEVMRELWHACRHKTSVVKARRFAGRNGLKLHVGCGPNVKLGWINIDLFAAAADLNLDVREPLPFGDGAAAVVYSEHFFEHLEYPGEALPFLRELMRVLAPGGLLSMGIPDASLSATSYANGNEDYYAHVKLEGQPPWVTTRMDHMNFDFRQGREHKYAYDLETLQKVLGEVGFGSVTARPFDDGLDSPARRWGTLYIEARKPARPPWPKTSDRRP